MNLLEILVERKKASAFVMKKHGNLFMLMKRTKDGSWGLPGGRLDKKEKAKDAATRETGEETGHYPTNIKKDSKIKKKQKTVHVYQTRITPAHIKQFDINKDEHSEYGFFTKKDLKKALEGKRTNVRDQDGNVLKTEKVRIHKVIKPYINKIVD